MKLSEIKGKKALEAIADLIDPLATIFSDKNFQEAYKSGKPVLEIAKMMLKSHPDEIITILAVLDGEDPENYKVDLLTLPKKLFEVINDPDIQTLFFSLDQTEI